MNFQGMLATHQRLYQESAAWRLLRADNAPMILAFLANLFADESEIPFNRARIFLDAELIRLREQGLWDADTNAGTYLNQWIRVGWLREMDDVLTKTDASEIALRFCRSLEQRNAGATASHLRIVQEAVRDFAVAISPSSNDRLALLGSRKTEIQNEIDALNAGVVVELSDAEKRERIREIYQLASVLTGDFHYVEDEIRQLDQDIRVQIIEDGSKRGDVLQAVMEKEALLSTTDAGSAFESFFQLLCDSNRSEELRSQLRTILDQPVAEQLNSRQRQFLGQLMRELAKESERVFQIRRRTEESLRGYIESGAAMENRAVDKLLGQLERLALELTKADINLQTATNLSLPVGAVQINSPDTIRLKQPDEQLDTSGVEEQVNSREPGINVLDCLESIQIQKVAEQTRMLLHQHGPLTIAGIADKYPMESGLEELVAYLRLAKSVGATQLENQESIEIRDKRGGKIKASIPVFLLSAELFPDNLYELAI